MAELLVKGLSEFREKLAKIGRAIVSNQGLMEQIGAFQSMSILARTAQGMDADDRMFRPYSKRYARRREKAGRPTNPVDLFFTGSMLNSLTHKAEAAKVTLFFMNTTDKYGIRNPAKAYWNNEIRKFFAISAKDMVEIENIIRTHIAKALV